MSCFLSECMESFNLITFLIQWSRLLFLHIPAFLLLSRPSLASMYVSHAARCPAVQYIADNNGKATLLEVLVQYNSKRK